MKLRRHRPAKPIPSEGWRYPWTDWIVSLRRLDGSRDVRKITRMPYAEAVKERDRMLGSGSYEGAWLIAVTGRKP